MLDFSIQRAQEGWEAYVLELEFKCQANGLPGISHLVHASGVQGAGLFLIGWSAYLYAGQPGAEWAALLVGLGVFPLIANGLAQEAAFEHRTRVLEKQLPDALLLWASFAPGVPMERGVEACATHLPEPLRSEWARVHRRLENGLSFSRAIEGLAEGRNSRLFFQARQLWVRAYASGISIASLAAGMAKDMLTAQSLHAERRATLLVEKYTLLLAGGLLVPFLLGLLVGVVESLPFGAIEGASPELYSAALVGIRGYLFFYSILAGAFVGVQEGNPRMGSVYVLALVPLAQLAYTLGGWLL